jgi:flavin-dependent dehydrogenase
VSEPRIAVLGAGPAGCAAAITFARAGVRPTVLERGVPGKDKPCGDAYLPDAVGWLASLGVPIEVVHGPRARPFTSIDLWDDRRPIWTVPLDGQIGMIAPRSVVDQALRDVAAACSDLRYGVSAVGLHGDVDGWRVAVRINGVTEVIGPFDAVVLATGAANALAREYGIAGEPIVGASMTAYLQVKDIDAPLFQFSPLGLDGYGWVFPLADGEVNIGVCAANQPPRDFRQRTESYLAQWCPGQIGEMRAGAGPMWSGRGSRWHDTRGVVSCGDAAGLVDPLTGEGIAPALESGIAAANAIVGWLASGPSDALGDYSRHISQTFGRRYSLTPARTIWRNLNQVTAA